MAATGYTSGDPQKVDTSGDTMTGELVLPDSSPDTALAAASRGYVDNTAQAVTAASETRYVNVAGDTMTGPLNLAAGGVDVNVQEALATVLSTGIISGGEMNVASPTSISISAVVGYIVDTDTSPTSPTVTRVTTNNQTVALTGASLARTVTWWLLNADGSITQQVERPTNSQRRTALVLGVTAYDTGSGNLFVDQSLPVVQAQPANQFADLLDALGPFIISGGVPSAASTNLTFNVSAYRMFSRAFNHYAGPTLTNDPHVFDVAAHLPASFRRILRAVTLPTPPVVTALDVANYDNAGVLTAVGGGAGSSTIQRVWVAGTNDAENQVLVQYGQTVYSSLDAAVAALQAGTFISAPVTADSALAGWIVVTRTATDLSNPSHARFIKAGRFATP